MTQLVKDNIPKDVKEQFEKDVNPGVYDCGCSTTSLPIESSTDKDKSPTQMNVTIDGREVEVIPTDKNIVDVANRAKIGIPAACYRAQRKKGCCHGCVVEIDGEQKYACATVPEKGMNIVVNREDLKAIRKKNLLEYNEGIKSGNPCKCSVSGANDCCG